MFSFAKQKLSKLLSIKTTLSQILIYLHKIQTHSPEKSISAKEFDLKKNFFLLLFCLIIYPEDIAWIPLNATTESFFPSDLKNVT